ncbi:MAG: adenylyltransferase/sulfurtransferase, partial [Bacillariaceae sp.]
MDEVEELRERVRVLEAENARLRHSEVENKEKLADVVDSSMNHDSSSPSFQGDLKAEHIERYSRQLLINGGFGVEGQLKLLNSSVLVIGAGGIGSTLILYLAACGIGNLSVVDFDNVDVSNLHRQVIHKTNDVGMNKAESARRAVENLNPSISCKIVKEPLTANNALELISSHDCIVDASDNPQTRYIINDACVLSGKPLVSGSAMG